VSTPASVAPLYLDGWRRFHDWLAATVKGLSEEQLQWRAAEPVMPIWGATAHVAGARVYWLCDVFKETRIGETPYSGVTVGWEDDVAHPRSVEELVWALESSWQIVLATLQRWTPDMMAEEFTRTRNGELQHHSRQSVITRLVTHDAFHVGEISQTLGMHGFVDIDPWSSPGGAVQKV